MKLAYLKEFWDLYQIKAELKNDFFTNPSILFVGESGTGKSSALKYNIYTLLTEFPSADIWFMNYKDSNDFKFLKSYNQYFVGEDCGQGLEAFYNHYCNMRKTVGENVKHITLAIIDEYAAFCLMNSATDKKLSDRYSRFLAEIIMTGRSYKTACWVATQRADAQYFVNGSREQFHVKVLLTRGRPSKESLMMMGISKEELQLDSYNVGEGIAYIDGKGLFEIKYPRYSHLKIETEILRILSGGSREAGGGTESCRTGYLD